MCKLKPNFMFTDPFTHDKITLKLLYLQIVELYLWNIDETGPGTVSITQTLKDANIVRNYEIAVRKVLLVAESLGGLYNTVVSHI